MADTRSKPKKKVEQRVEEELAPLSLEEATPLGMDSFARYMQENNKASEERQEKRRQQDLIDAEARQEERDRARRREAEEAEARAEKRQEEREARAEERRKQDLIEA